MNQNDIIESGRLSFSIEGRILRELGERLVKQPEVAVVELAKNAYDADATECDIEFDFPKSILVSDDGHGMTLDRFANGWMRVGTSSKAKIRKSEKYGRLITGEKGIGRFAVRFLGRQLQLVSVAEDKKRKTKTRLTAEFDWLQFDQYEDLGKVTVPYVLERIARDEPTGTKLVISGLRPEVEGLNLHKVRTGSIGIVTPLRSLFRNAAEVDKEDISGADDPGFVLKLRESEADVPEDLAASILDNFVLRARVKLRDDKLDIFKFDHGCGSDEIKFNIEPVVFKVPEKATNQATNIFVAMNGWLVAQIFADHLMDKNSPKEVQSAFSEMREKCDFFIGAAHRMNYLNSDPAPNCYRSTHWYAG
jgi:hypothetical protein